MEIFVFLPMVVGLIIFVTIFTIAFRIIRFGFKVGKNVTQTILEKTDPAYIRNKEKINEEIKEQANDDENQISPRLEQDEAQRGKIFVFCQYCGCKNKSSEIRCHSCKAPLKE